MADGGGEDWNPDDYDPDVREHHDLEADEAWQIRNNQLLVSWQAWPDALERYAQSWQARNGYPMSREHKAHLTQRYRERLREQYGTADVDPRWEDMRRARIQKREERQKAGR